MPFMSLAHCSLPPLCMQDGATALHMAAKYKQLPMVKALLGAKALPDVGDKVTRGLVVWMRSIFALSVNPNAIP